MVMPQITFDLMEASNILGPLALIIGGMTVYGVFVFNFYRFVSRKDIFTLNLQKHNQAKRPAMRKTISVVFYIFKFLVLYPVFVFFWFCVMAGLLYILSRNHTTETVMLVAMGVVGAIRICSYYKEALSVDIAKIVPFALLGIMLIDNSIVRFVESTESVWEAALLWETVIYYLVAVVVIEFLLRMTTGLFGLLKARRGARKLRRQKAAQAHKAAIGPQYAHHPPVPEPQSPAMSPAHAHAVSQGSGEENSSRGGRRTDSPAIPSVGQPATGVNLQSQEMPEVTDWMRRRATLAPPPSYAAGTSRKA
jgi:hypothetical protein